MTAFPFHPHHSRAVRLIGVAELGVSLFMTNPIIDLAPLAEPVTKFVEVVSQGIGGLYSPVGMIREARAQAEAQLILTEAEIECRDRLSRAAIRIAHLENQRQKNIEDIVETARQALPDKVSEEPVDPDWIHHFFLNAQDISNEELKRLWGRILSGEVSSPQTFSRRFIEFIRSVDKNEAEYFEEFLTYCCKNEQNSWFFYFEDKFTRSSMQERFKNKDLCRHFIDVGLIAAEDTHPLHT